MANYWPAMPSAAHWSITAHDRGKYGRVVTVSTGELVVSALLGGALGLALALIAREIARALRRWSLHRFGRQYERELRAARRRLRHRR